MLKKITLNSCEPKKQGVSAGGKAWTIYECRDASNNKFSTFTNLFDFVGVEKEYEVEQKESTAINQKTGKPFVNFTISLPKQGSRVQANTDALYEKMFTKLNSVEKKIDDLIASFEPTPDEEPEPPLENEPPF